MKDRAQFAEKWIDEALDRYSDAEPRDGFEARLVARLAEESPHVRANVGHERRFWLRWPVCAPALAAAMIILSVVGVVIERSHDRTIGRMKTGAVATIATAPTATAPPEPGFVIGRSDDRTIEPKTTIPLKPKKGWNGAPSRSGSENFPTLAARTWGTNTGKTEPRRPQFPTPTPLSEQEKLLLAYLKATPAEEIQNVLTIQQRQREEAERRAKELDRSQQNASPQNTTEPQINHLQFSPLENGTADSDARGAR